MLWLLEDVAAERIGPPSALSKRESRVAHLYAAKNFLSLRREIIYYSA